MKDKTHPRKRTYMASENANENRHTQTVGWRDLVQKSLQRMGDERAVGILGRAE